MVSEQEKECSNDRCSKVRKPQQKRSIETRNLIVNTAMQLFTEKGFHNTNTKEIAAKANVATGCVYSYFEDKKDVFWECMRNYKQEFISVVKEFKEREENTSDKKEYLRKMIEKLIDAHLIFSGFHKELLAMSKSDSGIAKEMEKMKMSSQQECEFLIKQSLEKKAVADVEASAMVIYHSVEAIVHIIAMGDTISVESKPGMTSKRLIDALVEMLYKYLCV